MQNKFVELVIDIHKKRSTILKENEELTSLRDFLLPLLMNGQVLIKEDKSNRVFSGAYFFTDTFPYILELLALYVLTC